MRAALLACVLAATVVAAGPATAGFFECRDADGNVSFQDHPCADGLTSREREEATRGISRATPADPGAAGAETPAPPARIDAPERPLVSVIAVPVRVPPDRRTVVHRGGTDGPEWREALAAARKNHRHGTLLRIYLEDATPDDLLQAQATRLSNPGEPGEGQRYLQFPSGTFVLLEHIGDTSAAGREAIEIGHPDHGTSKLWLPVAPRDTVAAGGDIVIGRMAPGQRGDLWVHLPAGYRKGPMVVGPLIAGGPYGTAFDCDANGACKAAGLAPGTYQLQFPGLDERRARFEATVEPAARREIDLRPGGPKLLRVVGRRTRAIPR